MKIVYYIKGLKGFMSKKEGKNKILPVNLPEEDQIYYRLKRRKNIAVINKTVSDDLNTEGEDMEKETLTKEEIQQIIREELSNALKELKNEKALEKAKKERVIVVKLQQPQPQVKETIIVEKPVSNPVVESKVEETKRVVNVPKQEEKNIVKSEPVKVEEKKQEVEKPEPIPESIATKVTIPIERTTFVQRLKESDDSLKANFNYLKSLLMSYGLKSRVSNSGDTFRLHTVTYCKMKVAGKGLKLHLALDPQDYADTKMPIKDVSSKAVYEDIPLTFKVKSGLSMRRAEELIRDCMEKHGLEQLETPVLKDWVSEIENMSSSDDE